MEQDKDVSQIRSTCNNCIKFSCKPRSPVRCFMIPSRVSPAAAAASYPWPVDQLHLVIRLRSAVFVIPILHETAELTSFVSSHFCYLELLVYL